jgi:hypothetical protein
MQTTFQCGRRTGVPQATGEFVYTPESLVMLVRVGGFGAVWNWPMAISVTRPASSDGLHHEDHPPADQRQADGSRHASVERHAIVDVTRFGLWIMGTITLLSLLAALAGPIVLRARRHKHERER